VENKSFQKKITIITIACSTIQNYILMGKNPRILMLCIATTFLHLISSAQTLTTVSGNVKDSATKQPIAQISIVIKGTGIGTYTDNAGNFKITTKQKPPFILVVSGISYETKEIEFSGEGSLNINMNVFYALGQDLVISASKWPEKIMKSPVSIERINATAIVQAPAPNYYSVLANTKGIDITTSSLTFNTFTTRGFNSSGNVRLNQIVDGMDNQAPGLNFSVGTVCGPIDLDVDNIELLEGASSALYGPGGTNGTLLINSKDPFKYQGVSAQVREGIMNVDSKYKDLSPYHDVSIRWGQKLSDKFAFKLNAQYIWAKDWLAADTSNYLAGVAGSHGAHVISGNRYTDPNYNGVNVYGDETSADIAPILYGAIGTLPEDQRPDAAAALSPFLNGTPVSRTGYNEAEVVPDVTKNLKFSGGLYYNIKPGLQASLLVYWGSGNSVYTGSDRYAFKDFSIGQYKLELKSKNWFLRGYTTRENAGESYNATVTTQLFNEAWKPSIDLTNFTGWYPDFSGALVQGALTTYYTVLGSGGTQEAAIKAVTDNQTALLNAARGYADIGRPSPGSDEFNKIFDQVRLTPIPQGGKFISKSRLYMYEGQYNLTDLLKIGSKEPLQVLIGGNYKKYILNTDGTIFADEPGHPIYINEVGGYLQLSQSLFKDVVKLTASGRYDKNENFAGHFTPRFSAVISVAKNHNIRLSYQTAYRFPTTQNQWIDLTIGGGVRLIGGLPDLRKMHNFDTNPVYTQASFEQFAGSGGTTPLVEQKFDEYKPESAKSFEIGYKGLIKNRLLIDAYLYFAHYQNFLGRILVFQSSDGTPAGLAIPNIYSVSVNSQNKVSAYGWGTSLQYLLNNNFFINANIFSDEITDIDENFAAYYNAPKYRFNAGFGNSGLGKSKRFGFNIVYRWQDAFFYESDFRQGDLPAFGVLDAQVSYKLPTQKILFKLGGTNITNQYYRNAFGNPYVGGLYYISFGYNVF
jgi:outer membrane receptor protein involved in Fe transport